MDCIEITYSDGYIEIPNESDPDRIEDWDAVKDQLRDVSGGGRLRGWGRWTAMWSGIDEFGDRRYYAVDDE